MFVMWRAKLQIKKKINYLINHFYPFHAIISQIIEYFLGKKEYFVYICRTELIIETIFIII